MPQTNNGGLAHAYPTCGTRTLKRITAYQKKGSPAQRSFPSWLLRCAFQRCFELGLLDGGDQVGRTNAVERAPFAFVRTVCVVEQP